MSEPFESGLRPWNRTPESTTKFLESLVEEVSSAIEFTQADFVALRTDSYWFEHVQAQEPQSIAYAGSLDVDLNEMRQREQQSTMLAKQWRNEHSADGQLEKSNATLLVIREALKDALAWRAEGGASFGKSEAAKRAILGLMRTLPSVKSRAIAREILSIFSRSPESILKILCEHGPSYGAPISPDRGPVIPSERLALMEQQRLNYGSMKQAKRCLEDYQRSALVGAYGSLKDAAEKAWRDLMKVRFEDVRSLRNSLQAQAYDSLDIAAVVYIITAPPSEVLVGDAAD